MSNLTASQGDAVTQLTSWWSTNEANIIVSGPPGTGKTFLARYFTESLRNAVPIFTAPTNEAVRQLELSLKSDKAVKTTYSALGLAMSTKSRKQQIYQRRLPDDFYDYNLMVIDEGSMAGKAEAGEKSLLMDYVENSGMRCIWLADWAQLPPVDGDRGESPLFEQGWKTLELAEVKRHSGVILDYAMQIREIIKKPVRNMPKVPEGIAVVRKENSMNFAPQTFDKIVANVANILVWTNRATKYNKRPGVDEYNTEIRNRLFGEKKAASSPVLAGDKILFASPLFEPEKGKALTMDNFLEIEFEIKASVNTRAEVLRTTPAKHLGFDVWDTMIELEGGATKHCFIPTRNGAVEKQKFEALLVETALNADSKDKQAEAWHYYHTFKQCFADIKYAYCVTGHRAQGSNIPEVYADVSNILQNRSRLVAFKNLYVCMTRAEEKLTLFM